MSSTPVHSKEEILSILSAGRGELSRLKIKSLALFGSFARGDFGEQSDVDLIVDLTEPVGFFTFTML
jgi:uncharacterized protein